jgi:RecB family endonuclease NucS
MKPIIFETTDGRSTVNATPFDNEAELQNALAKNPSLLQDDGDARLAHVRAEVTLPYGAGTLDLLLVDANGLPVAVEVKLARNGESRRQVVAQVVDYVASLTRLTVDELDQLVGGALEEALRSFSEDGAWRRGVRAAVADRRRKTAADCDARPGRPHDRADLVSGL